MGAMPAWAPVIGEDGVQQVAAYVRKDLAGLPLPADKPYDLDKGASIYAANCLACHGAEGKGMAVLGAPDLTSPAAGSTAAAWCSCNRPSAMAATARCRRRINTWATTRCIYWPLMYSA